MAVQHPPLGSPLDHFKLLCDYIKFHIGLYVATPPIFAVVANALSVASSRYFLGGWSIMVALCFISGLHASWFMGTHLNRSWNEGADVDWEKDATDVNRRIMQHYLYWIGVVAAFAGLIWAIIDKTKSVG
jgi:hypothetical protein